jgi:hypothetical protein
MDELAPARQPMYRLASDLATSGSFIMRWFRTLMTGMLAAVALMTGPLGNAPCQTRTDRLCRATCWYRVYYRACANKAWCYYATYKDSQRAQQVVDYLHFEGCEAYYQPVATATGA